LYTDHITFPNGTKILTIMNTDFSYLHLNNVRIVVFDFVSWTLPVLGAEYLQPGMFETILRIRRPHASYKTF